MSIPSTMATPPILGTGLVCTRGLPPPRSTPPIRGASLAVIGVSTNTMAADARNPHTTEPSSTSARRESVKDMAWL